MPDAGCFKKNYYLDRDIVPISSDTPTIETVSEHLDSEYWNILPTNVIGKLMTLAKS